MDYLMQKILSVILKRNVTGQIYDICK